MELDFDLGQLVINIALYLFMAIFIGMSQAAGLGGGPILNITLMMGMNYSTKESMAITYIFLLGGTVASMYSNFGKRNVANTKNLIDENLIILTLPMTVSGSVIGSLLNHFISQLIISILFILLLLMMAKNSYDKFKGSLTNKSQKQPLLNEQQLQQFDESQKQDRISRQTIRQMRPELQQIVTTQLIPMRWQNISLFLQIVALCLLFMLIKGSSSVDSIIGFPKCGWMSQGVVLIFIGIGYLYARHIFQKQRFSDIRKEELGFVFKKEQDRITMKFFKSALYIGFLAGCIGGMLGIGGSIILIPVWLQLGIDKEIATSSTAPLIFTSAFISMFIAFLAGMYDSFWLIIFHFVLAFCASFYIKKLVNWIKDKYKMEGIVFLLLFIMMVLSLVFLVPFELGKMISSPSDFFAFGQFC